MQERSKLQLLAAGAELVDPELELVWNWNIHVRKHPVRANTEVRPPPQAAALSATSVITPCPPMRSTARGFRSAVVACVHLPESSVCQLLAGLKLARQASGSLYGTMWHASSACMCLNPLHSKRQTFLRLQIPAACDSFARTYAALLSSRSQFHAAFAAHLLTMADAGLLPADRMDACLALISAPHGVA